MNDQLKQLAEKLSTGKRIVTVKGVHEGYFTLDVWCGLVHFDLNARTDTEVSDGRFIQNLQYHITREISKAEGKLATDDLTGYALHQYMMGKEGLSIYKEPWPTYQFPVVKSAEAILGPVQTFHLKPYEAMSPTGMMETRAFWLNDTLFMLEWKPVVPYGWRNFAGFLEALSDMELVLLQKQARETDDAESLNLILVELGKRHRPVTIEAKATP